MFKLFALLYFIQSISAYIVGDDGKFIALSTKLKFNDSCSYDVEQIRETFTRTLLTSISDQAKIDAAMGLKDEVVKKAEALCSSVELLVCSKEKHTCVCGDPAKVALRGHSDGYKGYEVEKTSTGPKCRWAQDSPCVSEEYLKAIISATGSSIQIKVDSKCREATKCSAVGSGLPCTLDEMTNYAKKTGRVQPDQLARDLYDGKICTCKKSSARKLYPSPIFLTMFIFYFL